MADSQKLAIPMKLDAFVFNGKVCDGGGDETPAAKIAPLTQPNYTFLRITKNLVQNDILETVDLHSAWPRKANSRYTDLATGLPRQKRLGVYLHWLIPRPYRSGVAATETASEIPVAPPKPDGDPSLKEDKTSPNYFRIPNRWLIIRTLDPKDLATLPKEAPIPSVQAWVIESDRMYSIDKLGPEVDLQVDVSPFITSFLAKGESADQISIQKQAEIFIGRCTDAKQWRKDSADPPEDIERVNITAASSSNPLFLDFQHHNSNVFSFVDNFAYTEGGETKYLKGANANYYVLGWHSNPGSDVLDAGVNRGAKDKSRAGRLAVLNMLLDSSIPKDNKVAEWMKEESSSQSVCHGAMYSVEWSSDDLPKKRPADAFAQIMKPAKPPLAVGTTPVDAILSYISDRTPSNDTEVLLAKLQTLLKVADDTIDSHVAAEDEVQNYNYAHFDGGNFYYLPGPGDQVGRNVGTPPSDDARKKMIVINSAQKLVDNIDRRSRQLRWELFACWWRTISDIDGDGNSLPGVNAENYPKTVKDLTDALNRLRSLRSSLLDFVIKSPEAPIKTGLVEDFHQRKDPTLMVAGLESDWPKDFSNQLKVRLDEQIVPNVDAVPQLPTEFGLEKLPTSLEKIGPRLVKEFLELATHQDPKEKPTNCILPLYHDGKYSGDASKSNPWRDRWASQQPWFPLFLEWEAEYIHIPFEDWRLTTRPCSKKPDLAPKISYTLAKDVCKKEADAPAVDPKDPNKGPIFESRVAHGRSLILPQPAFSLKIQLERLFGTISQPKLNKIISEAERKTLLDGLERISFLSVPLTGLTDHLVTRYQGNHIKPLVRVPGYKPVVMREVITAAEKISIDSKLLADIDTESDPTPYASLPALVGLPDCAFKPVTHGQLRFTKLNVIDKFGQAVHALNPKDEEPKALYPSISDFYSVDPVPKPRPEPPAKPGECGNLPNVVDRSRSKTMAKCEFVQLPPSINQPSRINASFLIHGDTKHGEFYWRPPTEWENPVWGWVVINYVDNGIQIFQPNGTFYREVRVTEGTNNNVEWLPFRPPAIEGPNRQLEYLIQKMTAADGKGQAYLRAFMNIISSALQNVVPAPGAYGQFLNSLIGRPLALVNMGWSLELDSKPFSNQSTVEGQQEAKAPQPRHLTKDPKKPKRPAYQFPFKLGDKSRNYDGLVGYFKAKPPPVSGDDSRKDDDLLLDKIYTYFGTSKPEDYKLDDLAQPIDGDRNPYPLFDAYWQDPEDYVVYNPGREPEKAFEDTARKHERERNERFSDNAFGAILDPFSPVTCFSSILPVRTLQLASWTWESAFKEMTTFFHAGPLLTTSAVPDFKQDNRLKSGYDLASSTPADSLALPALQAADWNWLMPYYITLSKQPDPSLPPTDSLDEDPPVPDPLPPLPQTEFVALGVTKADTALGNPGNAPLEALEGYLQLRQPIERDKPLETPVKPAE